MLRVDPRNLPARGDVIHCTFVSGGSVIVASTPGLPDTNDQSTTRAPASKSRGQVTAPTARGRACGGLARQPRGRPARAYPPSSPSRPSFHGVHPEEYDS